MSLSLPRLRAAGPLLLLLLALLIPLWAVLEEPGAPMDEGTLLVYPEQILHGKVPYRDFETFYAPGNLYLLAGVYGVLTPHVLVERAVGILYRLLIFLSLYQIGKRWSPLAGATGAVLAAVLLLPTLTLAYAWMGAMALALWALWLAAGAERPGTALGSGLLAGLALLFRQDVGPAMLLGMLPLFLLLPGPLRGRCLLGGALGLLPLAVLTVAAGPGELWKNLFLYPVVVCNPARRLPLAQAEPYLLRILALHGAAVLVLLAAGGLEWRRERRSAGGRLLLGAGLFALGLTHQAVQRTDFVHVPYAAFVSIGLLPAGLLVLFRRVRPEWAERWAPMAASVVAAGLMAGLGFPLVQFFGTVLKGQLLAEENPTIQVQHGARRFPDGTFLSGYNAGLMVETLSRQATPGQRLLVGPHDLRRTNGCDTYLYHLLPELTPATYFLEMNPRSANRPASRLTSDLLSADWLLLNARWDYWTEPNASQEYGPEEPNQVVREHFQPVARHGYWLLYRRRG